jgi:ComF family protein
MLGSLLDLLGATRETCLLCGGRAGEPYQGFVCGACLRRIRPEPALTSPRKLGASRVFGRYEGELREVLKLIKFRRVKPLARILGAIVGEDLKSWTREVSPDLVTFVPVHPFRRWSRGFDQNEEILRGAGLEFGKVLRRVRYSRPLAGFARGERSRAVRGAFRVKEESVRGKKVLVLDDIITTGTTASEVAETLYAAGAKEVYFYFIASED